MQQLHFSSQISSTSVSNATSAPEPFAGYIIGNDWQQVGVLIATIKRELQDNYQLNEIDSTHLLTALREAVANAILHGNLEMPSELLERDEATFHKLAEERMKKSPYVHRRVSIVVRRHENAIEIVVRDQGKGMDSNLVGTYDEVDNLDRIGGRGIYLMKHLVDSIEYNEIGNQVTLRKKVHS